MFCRAGTISDHNGFVCFAELYYIEDSKALEEVQKIDKSECTICHRKFKSASEAKAHLAKDHTEQEKQKRFVFHLKHQTPDKSVGGGGGEKRESVSCVSAMCAHSAV